MLLYMLGLSYRQASAVLGELGMPASPATILGDVRAYRMGAESFHQRLRKRTRVLRMPLQDAGAASPDQSQRVLIAVNQEDGQGLFVEPRESDHVQEILGLISLAVEHWRQGGGSVPAGPST